MEKRIRIWNTLSGKKEKIPARRGKPIRLFVCGPTVYDLTHIGHARTYVFFDFFVKYLRMKGLPGGGGGGNLLHSQKLSLKVTSPT